MEKFNEDKNVDLFKTSMWYNTLSYFFIGAVTGPIICFTVS